ncbi:transglycosylase domain-containing protein [Sphaerisporangium sp. TRM90804]|uniref:transglycosylase domain-containing protein n=1 Tax=Sphaerisporangium sp. TRM90804 TaxID=3031113 RepID=UPI002446B2E0|nr:transglycosylase domain-containing protein [Sphaerisporangium sp. TRM90804]MDH2428584.1 transglycosylase domain-containing protein [Sphaerisporangium sp. TRM90804]
MTSGSDGRRAPGGEPTQHRPRERPVPVSIAALGVAGVAGGLLAAAVALPVVGGAGLFTRNASRDFFDVPTTLREAPLPERTKLLDKDGKQFAQFYVQNRQSVPLGQIAPVMLKAIVAIEDSRFYKHAGLDLRGTLRAIIANTRAGKIEQGGSSLTQQLVKNILLQNAHSESERDLARAPSVRRKLQELRYAMGLEKKYTKEQILVRYLNIAYFGGGAFGVQAAAQRFFGTTAADLTLAQAATLAAAVRTPYLTDPALGAKHRARLLERRDLVLDRMTQLGMTAKTLTDAAKATPLALNLRPEPGGCSESAYPFFCLYVQKDIVANPVFGRSRAERERRLYRDGLVIRTTLDPRIQKAAEKAISSYVNPEDDQVAAEAMIEPGTGRIRALAASKLYGVNPGDRNDGPRTTFNLPADTAHGGGLGFQAGSTFKVFTLATALAQGWRFDQGFDTPGSFSPSSGYKDCSGRKVNDPGAVVHNAGGEGRGGPYSLSTGTWQSVNIFYMMLERDVGLCEVVRTARAVGIARADGRPLREVPTFTLGSNEMDPVTVAAAFAAFGARGRYCRPMPVLEIVERHGRRTPIAPSCSQSIEQEVADAVNHILTGVFTRGTMKGQGIGRDAAGKTGTNNGYTSAWFAGYTPELAAAVSLGDIRGAYKYPLTGVEIGGRQYGGVQGATLPGPIWVSSMTRALRDVPATSFSPPDTGRFGGGTTPGLAPEDMLADPRAEADGDDRDRGEGRRRLRRQWHRPADDWNPFWPVPDYGRPAARPRYYRDEHGEPYLDTPPPGRWTPRHHDEWRPRRPDHW